ncbi:HSC20 (HSCB), C-terminal oligomerisation [Glarea lozoyensis ATCC 20868]|uniref:HSC20 (HSCB), C-terminal oligomerisation n=1 Tax=Glarea lozoyensis (strain ATCC 20868 / MF5171) TaxID=1116229 RepID=S3CPP2_GLAL2|nr:HSC20 (HSCB), C-terminal oligomerization [Glarea lozoyensis ATCC 20868]EPE27109.1 HSC20 (HSCB), C-terminal oligomerisation [Glarea lozoyensis ATCC 20868]
MRSSTLRQARKIIRNPGVETRQDIGSRFVQRSTLPTTCLRCSGISPGYSNYSRFQRRWQTSARTSQTGSNIPPKAETVPQTHYEFFPKTLPQGPPPSGPFRIDARELRKEFLQLQAVAHPDRHPTHLKSRAEGTSARINEAYKTLQNPLLRTQYLLSMKGIDVAEDETLKVEDPELLMEVLDTQEEIENAQNEEDLIDMKKINDERIAKSEEILDGAFREENITLAKEEAVRMRYWVNIKESLDAWEKGKPVALVH